MNLKSILPYLKLRNNKFRGDVRRLQQGLQLDLSDRPNPNSERTELRQQKTDSDQHHLESEIQGTDLRRFRNQDGVQTGRWALALLFNCALVKGICKWRKEMNKEIGSGWTIGGMNLTTDCQTYADDLSIFFLIRWAQKQNKSTIPRPKQQRRASRSASRKQSS